MEKKILNKVILIIRDGWGHRKERKFNAIAQAKTPVDDRLRKEYPWTLIKTSGEAVGLPHGYQGNSEVGHLTIGSGRIPEQSLLRINNSIRKGEFFRKKEFLKAISEAKKKKGRLHLIGLLQKEGVHAHMDHLFALLEICKSERFKDVYIHAITDGRDTPVNKGRSFLKELTKKTKFLDLGEIVTLSGRYYAMDRDKRWERTKKAYDAIVLGKSNYFFDDPISEIKNRYSGGETDEFIFPTVKRGYEGIKDGDSIIFYNLRTDRPRQLTQAIIEKKFSGWKRKPKNVYFVAMTEYYSLMEAKVAFRETPMNNLLGEILRDNGIKQLRISETEKYAHVTYFFNGQKEIPLAGEKRMMIPSPKVLTYDEKPEMNIEKVVQMLEREIKNGDYGFIIVNFPNADMVGHTGNMKATMKAVGAVDEAVGKVIGVGLSCGFSIFVFADHGNAEDQSGKWQTSHTARPVPLIFVSERYNNLSLRKGMGLKDIAPSVLHLMEIKKPREMTGKPIFIRKKGTLNPKQKDRKNT